jgi:hypothetical protein
MELAERQQVIKFLKYCNTLWPISCKSKQNFLRNYLADNIQRSLSVLESFLLVDKENVNGKFEHPIGIMLRSPLLDYIIFTLHAGNATKGDGLDLDKFEKDISEQIKAHLNYCKNDPTARAFYKHIYEKKENGKVREFSEIKSVLKKAHQHAEEFNNPLFSTVAGIWEWYSKYEHYGWFTKGAVDHFDNDYRQKIAVFHIMQYIYLCLTTLADLKVDGLNVKEMKVDVFNIFKVYVDLISLPIKSKA